MKSHERKAVLRALDRAATQIQGEYQRDSISSKMLRHIALRAVKIAQLRAGRTYDDETANDLRTYAYKKSVRGGMEVGIMNRDFWVTMPIPEVLKADVVRHPMVYPDKGDYALISCFLTGVAPCFFGDKIGKGHLYMSQGGVPFAYFLKEYPGMEPYTLLIAPYSIDSERNKIVASIKRVTTDWSRRNLKSRLSEFESMIGRGLPAQ